MFDFVGQKHILVSHLNSTLHTASFKFHVIIFIQKPHGDERLKFDILDINCPNHLGNTPLHEAILHGNEQMIDFILSQPEVDVAIGNKAGVTALHMCAKSLKSKEILMGENG